MVFVRPKRSFFRRLSPLIVVVAGLAAFITHVGVADANTPEGKKLGVDCQSTNGFQSHFFTINGPKRGDYQQIVGKVHQGDTVELHFVLKKKCSGLWVGLKSYELNDVSSAKFTLQQTVFNADSRVAEVDPSMPATEQVRKIKVPSCYFQVDAFTSSTFVVGQFTGSGGPGFIAGDIGGADNKCGAPTPPQPKSPQPQPKPVVSNSADISPFCKANAYEKSAAGWSVVYTNGGNSRQTFVMRGAGAQLDTVELAAGKAVTKSYWFDTYSLPSNEPVTLTASVGSNQVATKSVIDNCAGVPVEASAASNAPPSCICVSSGPPAVAAASAVVPAAQTVTPVVPAVVPAAKTVTPPLPAVQVLAETKTPPAPAPAPTAAPQLPVTGFDVVPLVVVGAALMILGIALLLGVRWQTDVVRRVRYSPLR